MMESSEEATLPSKYGSFMVRAFRGRDGREHLAVFKGDMRSEGVPVRIHSECKTGDVFMSLACDCGKQLIRALEYIESKGTGAILYLAQEGRGIGLLNKINAYKLQESGLDTCEANEKLGFRCDERDYGDAVWILRELGIRSVKVITNNRQKIRSIEEAGIKVVGRIPIRTKPTRYNRRYLQTKKSRMGQLL